MIHHGFYPKCQLVKWMCIFFEELEDSVRQVRLFLLLEVMVPL